MTTLPILVRVCIWVVGFTSWRLLECSLAPLSFPLWIVVKLLCSCLYLLDAIVEVHAINNNSVQ
jgi:hypothetical protein